FLFHFTPSTSTHLYTLSLHDALPIFFLAGEVDLNGGLVMKNPEYEKVSSDPSHAARIVPIYPETRGLTSRWLRPKIRPLLWLARSEEHTSELQSRENLVCRLLLEKKK